MDVDKILSQLTLQEKILLLCGVDNWHTYPIPRLGVPKVKFTDGPNGARGAKTFNGSAAACFPCGTALGATFNQQLVEEAGALMAVEAKHKSAHVILGPTVNMQRGPLGGRGFESFSEDPYLAGMTCAAVVRGMQSQNVAATVKHFVCNDLEHERKANDALLSERALREIYLEPFRLTVKYSDPVCIMTSYNKVNGDRCSSSKKFLDDIARKEWGWNGIVVSDWHGTYSSGEAIINGLDLEMPGPTYYRDPKMLTHMVESRELHVKHINARVRNVLRLAKYGLESGIPEDGAEDELNNTPETSELLRKFASEAIVLLRNDDQILPLKKSESVAIMGPNAKFCAFSGGGSAFLRPYYLTTPYDSICQKLDTEPSYTVGCQAFKNLPSLATQLLNPVTGKQGYNMKFFDKSVDDSSRKQFDELNINQSYIFLQDYVHDDLEGDLYYIDVEGDFIADDTGDYRFGCAVLGTALLYVNDKLVVDNKNNQKKGTIFFNSGSTEKTNTVYLEKGQKYRVRLEFGSRPTFTVTDGKVVDFGGGGGFSFGCAKEIDADAEIEKAVSIAKSVDKVVLNIGLNNEFESEGHDREHMRLPGLTDRLVAAVLDANPNTVVVNQSGTPVEFPWLDKCKCLVQAWYGGNETGNAIADVLFGDVNPSGRMSLTFPKKVDDNPTYLNFRAEKGRILYGEDIFMGYRYYDKMKRATAFSFGDGLSYSSFSYGELDVKVDEDADTLEVRVAVTNTSGVAGQEVVQVYVGSEACETIRPAKELKGFSKVMIQPQETAQVVIAMSLKDSCSFYDEYDECWSLESGRYRLQVGSTSTDIKVSHTIEVSGAKQWTGL